MALHNLPDLYTGGAVRVSSQPEVALYGQLLQRQQAKKDALDQYYQKQISDVTPAGMRNKDVVGGWTKKLNDFQEFAMNPQNKKYLENPRLDGYKTATEFNQRHADLLADADRSKQEQKDELAAFELLKAGKLKLTDDDMDIVHRKGLSIYDPQRKDNTGNEPDLMKLSFTHEFTPLQETQMYNNATKGIPKNKIPDQTNQRNDKATGMIYTPYSKGFNTGQVKNIADNFANSLTPDAKSHYETLMKEPQNYGTWTNAYQTVYGKTLPDGTPNLLDTPDKAAKAVAILHANAETETGEDKAPDLQARQAFSLKKQAIAHQNSLENIRLSAGLRGNDPETINKNVDGIIATHIANSEGLDGEVPLSAETFKILTGETLGKRSVAKVDKGGNYTVGRREDDGTISNQKTIPYLEAKAALTKGYKSGLTGSYNSGSTKPPVVKATNIPSHSKADFLKSGWTEDQIKQALKAGKIKVQ